MADYSPIQFVKSAEQFPEQTEENPPNEVILNGETYQVYRDQGGYYIFIETTKNGRQRINPTEWAMLESIATEATPEIPSIPGVPATGSIALPDLATGDGTVGFSYRGVIYEVTPLAGDSDTVVLPQLAAIINLGGQMTATLNEENTLISVVMNGVGALKNKPLTDVSTDSTMVTVNLGMLGGTTFTPRVPAYQAQPAKYSVWTDELFQATFEVSA
jgi:hypothetical protein